jgi:hypothetical protein
MRCTTRLVRLERPMASKVSVSDPSEGFSMIPTRFGSYGATLHVAAISSGVERITSPTRYPAAHINGLIAYVCSQLHDAGRKRTSDDWARE